jgi:hypothetical protein
LAQPAVSMVSAMLIVSILPLVSLFVAVALSLKYPLKRKGIGTSVAVIGVLEMLGFFMLSFTIEEVTYRIPFSPRIIMLMQGSITLIGGLVMLFFAKTKRRDLERSIVSSVGKQEMPLREDTNDRTAQMDNIDAKSIGTEKETT